MSTPGTESARFGTVAPPVAIRCNVADRLVPNCFRMGPGSEAPMTRDELVSAAAVLGRQFATRAAKFDVEASFPYEDFADLREAGFLGLCVPAEYGGLGASFADYCRVSNELGRHAPATALAFNMHCVTMLLAGQIADDLTWTAEERD